MSKPDWKDAPPDANYARYWMGKWHWFKRCPGAPVMWQEFESGRWWLTRMSNVVFISLEARP